MARRIGIVSVARSDWGHLQPLIALLPEATVFEPVRDIRPARDLPCEIAFSFGKHVTDFAEIFEHATERPEVIVIFGDRWEQLAAATAAMILTIPIVHLHAGESTQAVIDDQCRAAISAMATIHVAAAEPYAARLRAQGYERVYCLGAPGLARLPRRGQPVWTGERKRLLVAFHPETKNLDDVKRQAHELRMAVENVPHSEFFLTEPGMDAGRQAVIDEFAGYDWAKFTDDEWLAQMAYSGVLVGNSSCGIIEAPSIPLACVNIGDRQKGRLMASSVIQAPHDRHAIRGAIQQALDPEWRHANLTGVNPYGDRQAAERIAEMLRTVSL